ncbi:hypothetical protein GQS65_18225 [Halomarina oriensis]|uniref:Uncharacterized protein n=2 Tax=Halomarina oriensis TaxID=671145 RepID=A0A6B0GSU8_9EURY|nr:poly-gamma-glutamate hydrolase family protein [Halomarina oriensis]MWG36397.1 hypothetical protein [Halomarina oriensis]
MTRRRLLIQSVAAAGTFGAGRAATAAAGSDDERREVRVTGAISDDEVCRLPRSVTSSLGVVAGQQVRLRHEDGPAVFTVVPTDEAVGAVGTGGRDRLGATGDAFDVEVSTRVVHPTRDEATAADTGGFVERLVDADDERLVVLAPHGGYIEYGTDEQATHVGERLDVPVWYCAGWWPGGGAFDRWHVGSTDIHPASFPRLAEVSNRSFDAVVGFHGWGEDHVAVGGAAPLDRRRTVRDTIAAAVGDAFDVRLASDESRDGDHPDNVVNWLSASGRDGVQIEQPWDARREYGRTIADAVADVFE